MGKSKTGARRGRRSAAPWIMVTVAVAAGLLLASRKSEAAHPTPRDMDHAEHIVDSRQFAGYERVQDAYRMAAAIPNVLDGIYCYCACAEHSGHHSLHDCFTSEHGARCDICMSEAALAYRLTRDGASLDEVRDAIDALYRT